jgi:hypothetical protein
MKGKIITEKLSSSKYHFIEITFCDSDAAQLFMQNLKSLSMILKFATLRVFDPPMKSIAQLLLCGPS